MRRGVIDIGTNSVKLLIADLRGDDILPHLETSRQTRLGQGLYATGKLQAEPIRATVDAVNELLALAKRNDCADTRIIATSAVREASNSGELIAALGQTVTVLSGDDEARLVFVGVMSCPRLAKSPALVIDTGGGSTEFIVGDADGMRFHTSLPLGSVRLMERHAVSDPPTTGEQETVHNTIGENLSETALPGLREQLTALGQASPLTMIGSGGMAGILAKMELADDEYDREQMESVELPLARVTAWRERLWSLPLAKRREITGLPKSRANVALYGSLIYEQALRQLGFATLRITTRGIRFGVLRS
ncbi:MAG: exopolyphosphatase/guanosine-5'-triphosphate,3'-diphosphate pyrophosphatase [Limisphaerales bacterium]|jgi:exopolyphosphatase/guanosine-5'-triphosphate,3'-diphosphate pyrophosphatase